MQHCVPPPPHVDLRLNRNVSVSAVLFVQFAMRDLTFVVHAPLLRSPQTQRRGRYATSCQPRMIEQNTVLAVGAALMGIGSGIALVAFTEQQGARTESRANTRSCVECKGETRVMCNVCKGSGKDPLGDKDPTRDGPCKYCDGAKTIRCFNCQGSGVQPRFLDRYASASMLAHLLTILTLLCALLRVRKAVTRGFHGLAAIRDALEYHYMCYHRPRTRYLEKCGFRS